MRGTLADGRPQKRGRRGVALAAAALLCASVGMTVSPAIAKRMAGSAHADVIAGTKKADSINGRGGKDRINGRGGRDKLRGGAGKDRLRGGKGADRVIGGKGPDRHAGGRGADIINSTDGHRDLAINGGPGKDKCLIDTTIELSVTRGCETVKLGGSPGATSGSDHQLRVLTATGLGCASQLPVCPFTISGDGADGLAGLVTGGGGVVVAAGGAVSPSAPNWTAAGTYGCSDDGFLRVTIGSKSVDVPVTCSV